MAGILLFSDECRPSETQFMRSSHAIFHLDASRLHVRRRDRANRAGASARTTTTTTSATATAGDSASAQINADGLCAAGEDDGRRDSVRAEQGSGWDGDDVRARWVVQARVVGERE